MQRDYCSPGLLAEVNNKKWREERGNQISPRHIDPTQWQARGAFNLS